MKQEKKWCMCKNIGGVARDMYSTCSRCGGKDAYGTSKGRPPHKRKILSPAYAKATEPWEKYKDKIVDSTPYGDSGRKFCFGI